MPSAAICDQCKTPILHPNPAYVVSSYDPERLLAQAITSTILHYQCIHLFFTEASLLR